MQPPLAVTDVSPLELQFSKNEYKIRKREFGELRKIALLELLMKKHDIILYESLRRRTLF